MTVADALAGVKLKSPIPPELAPKPVAGLDYDSRRIERDFLFFAFPGSKADGRAFASQALERGAVAVVSETEGPMEVPSHGLALGRVYGMQFHTAVFTNLTRDHLDFHHTMEEYFAAKQMLFTGAAPPLFAVVNADDFHGRQIRTESDTTV